MSNVIKQFFPGQSIIDFYGEKTTVVRQYKNVVIASNGEYYDVSKVFPIN